MFHFWSQISWNLRCAEPKPHITLLHFDCSRWGLPKKTGIGTPTHYGARFFFLAAVRMPVHILDFFNTSQARIVFFIASSPKVWSASRFFTSGIKFATIIFASSKLNENHCRILTVLPRSRFSRLRCAKPTWEHHFFCHFKILTSSKLRFSLRDSHYMSQSALPCVRGDENKTSGVAARVRILIF